MKYIDDFRKKKDILKIAGRIKRIMPKRRVNIMEVCGTHTQNFYRFGLKDLLPPNLRLISGPGCPVCVSSREYIDQAIGLARNKDVIIATFGDMLRIPGSSSSLEKEIAGCADVRVVYSALDSLILAKSNPRKRVVFLAVGFETTAPTIALTILSAKKRRLKNFFCFSSLKLIPPAMEHLAQGSRLRVDGFLCPGHVSAIIGMKPYEKIARSCGLNCCVAGFEPVDILEGICLLLRQIDDPQPKAENQYRRVVSHSGNLEAAKIIKQVFQVSSDNWRGLGVIPASGLQIRKGYASFDARKEFLISRLSVAPDAEQKRCRCGDILKGLISPLQCPLFARQCTINNPVGPCMVTNEGACNAYYKYR